MGIFYAQSWALIHYLMLGNNGARRPQLTRFINGLNGDLPLEENFRQSFQTDYAKMEGELRAYLRKESYPVLEYTLDKPLELGSAVSTTLTEAEVEYHLGDLLLRSFRLDEAAERLQKSIALDANFAPARVSLGHARIYQQRAADAQKILSEALALDPRNALAHYYYASALRAEDKLEEALASYQQAIALKPDLAGAHSELGRLYRDLRRNEEAVESYNQAIRHAPDVASHYQSRAYVNLQLGRGNGAAYDAKAFLHLQSWRDDSAPYLALAAYFGYRQKGRAADAAQCRRAAAKTDDATAACPRPSSILQSNSRRRMLKQATDNDKLTKRTPTRTRSLPQRHPATHSRLWVRETAKRFVEYPSRSRRSIASIGSKPDAVNCPPPAATRIDLTLSS